jgi:cobalt/nickel transport system permease protein
MARKSYSKHIPDFRLVTHYAESRTSIIHRMNPWTKAVLLVFVILFVIIIQDPYLLAILLVATVAFYASARLPLTLLLGWYTLPVFFVLTLAVLFVFSEPGRQLASIRLLGTRIALTESGVVLVGNLLMRALAAVTFSLAFFMTTRYTNVAVIASRSLPKPLDNIFLLSYRFTFETSDEIADVLDAMRSRSGGLAKGVSRQTKMFAGIIGLAFVHAFERAERIAKAMEARGFTGTFPMTEQIPRMRYGDYALISLVALALAIVAYSRYFSNLIGW